MKKRISFIYFAAACARLPLALLMAFALCACASDDEKVGGVAYQYEPSETTRQNPSSYFMDGFNVQKDRKARPGTTSPFFFKHCDQGHGSAPWSTTTYSCDYTM